MRAKKSLGQNFLTSKAILGDIIKASDLSSEDTVLEIGPGKGFLTEELLKNSRKILAIEKDGRLIELLEEKFKEEIDSKKLILIHGDVLDFQPQKHGLSDLNYKLIANIPYYLTGQIFRLFLESSIQPSKMILMVQKEVSDRIVARDGKESILSMSVKAYGTPRYIKKVPARYFSPKPKVDSAVILIDNISKDTFKNKNEEQDFFELMKTGFSHKRKTLLNNLSDVYEKQQATEALNNCDISLKERAEKLNVKNWMCLLNTLN